MVKIDGVTHNMHHSPHQRPDSHVAVELNHVIKRNQTVKEGGSVAIEYRLVHAPFALSCGHVYGKNTSIKGEHRTHKSHI